MALQSWLANLGASFKRDAPTPRTLEDVAENVCIPMLLLSRQLILCVTDP